MPPPGITKDIPEYTAGPRWVDTDKVRFRDGFPEVIGGWSKLVSTTLDGVCRASHSWTQLDGTPNMAFGTQCYLYVYEGGTIYDITPFRTIDAALANNPFATVNLSTTVTVTHTSHGAVTDDRVVFSGAAAVNGITLSGEYTLTKVNDNSYTVTAGNAATGTGSGGGAAVLADYTVNCGLANTTLGYGYGAGTWNNSTWNTARSTSTVTLDLHIWSMDNWGEDLIAAVREGGVYVWDSSGGTSARAAAMSGAPASVGLIAVSGQDRHVIAFGAYDGSAYDPMLVRWSDQEAYTTWTATDTNSAGSIRLAQGSEIRAYAKSRGEILILTDTDIYGMRYAGPPFTFAIEHIGNGCGIVGPNALAAYMGKVFWMSTDAFYVFDGTQRIIECPVQDHIFSNLDYLQKDKVVAGINKEFNEIWWFYQTTASTEIDRYVIYNIVDETWAVGTLERTSWEPRATFTLPIATDASGNIWYHEVGNAGDGSAISAYAETGEFQIGEGDKLTFLDRAIPDMSGAGTVQLTVKTRKYPNATEVSKGPYNASTSTEKIGFRARGRQFAFRWAANVTNFWRLGKWRARIRADGGR